MPIYTFYVELEDGQRLEWTGLTQRQAMSMYRLTANNISLNTSVKGYGWNEK